MFRPPETGRNFFLNPEFHHATLPLANAVSGRLPDEVEVRQKSVKLKRGIIVLFFLIAMIGVVVWLSFFSGPPGPQVKGVPISRWLATIPYGDRKQLDNLAAVG